MNYLHYKNTVLELCLVTVFLKTKKILTATATIKKAVQCSVATSVTCGSMMSALDLMNMK